MRVLYLKICIVYNFFSSLIQNLFFKKKLITFNKCNLHNYGYELFLFENNLNKFYSVEKKINKTKYLIKDIVFEDSIFKIINLIFIDNGFAKKISALTGFEYSIDFFISYETFNIPEYYQNQDWYANKWHNDKPFSKNTLKFIIPLNLEDNKEQTGGIEILNINQSKNYIKNNMIPNSKNIFIMKNFEDELLVFNPNICYHRAGNPEEGKSRKQIMLQLNPSFKWSVNSKIYYKQFKIEPKFPSINYLFDKKFKLSN